ncbi:MAG: Na/Pi cotransporter family protein [Verrucomicrobia bacterium]|jgi:phosphate:Na+ symporter|nr:Na/Pi cotransporter family protein [Verrucomicrobiota bacterium]
MLLLNIATGIILILLGMRYLRKGLDRLFGSHLVDWLQQMTQNRYQAFFAGLVAGTIAPSSTAIAMLSVQMLTQTALTAGRMLAVVLGASVGITVSVQLLAFRLQDYAGAFMSVGGVGFLFSKRAIFRGAGQMLLGLGLVFLAMGIISSAGATAAANRDVKLLFGVLENYPLVVFAGTAMLTVGLQSSTASIGLGIGLAQAGLVSAIAIVPWVLGANLGIAVTMMIAGWGSVEGRRLAIGSLLIRGCGALLTLLGGSKFFVFILNLLPGAIDRQAANLNTCFNLLLGLVALPLLSPISGVLTFLIEPQAPDESRQPDSYLDPLLLQTPSLALNQAAREELRLMDELKLMLRTVWTMLWGKNLRLVSRVEEHQRRIDHILDELKEYLGQISDENLSEEDADWKFNMLDYAQELAAISTLIRRDLADAAIRQIQLNQELSLEDGQELESFYARTLERIEKGTLILMSRDPGLAAEFIREKEEINVKHRLSRKARLEKPLTVQNAASNVVDIINCLRRINSQLTSLAYAIVRDSSRSGVASGSGTDLDTEEALVQEIGGPPNRSE